MKLFHLSPSARFSSLAVISIITLFPYSEGWAKSNLPLFLEVFGKRSDQLFERSKVDLKNETKKISAKYESKLKKLQEMSNPKSSPEKRQPASDSACKESEGMSGCMMRAFNHVDLSELRDHPISYITLSMVSIMMMAMDHQMLQIKQFPWVKNFMDQGINVSIKSLSPEKLENVKAGIDRKSKKIHGDENIHALIEAKLAANFIQMVYEMNAPSGELNEITERAPELVAFLKTIQISPEKIQIAEQSLKQWMKILP